MNTVWSWSVIGLFYQCGIGCTVGFGAEVSVMWYGCLVWVVLCGAGTLLVSILGPAWRQSRTLGEVVQPPILKMKKRILVAGHRSGASFKYLRRRK